MAKVKNVSGQDRLVAGLLVLAGQVIEVSDEDAIRYVSQGLSPGSGLGQVGTVWVPADEVSQAALDEYLAEPEIDESTEGSEV